MKTYRHFYIKGLFYSLLLLFFSCSDYYETPVLSSTCENNLSHHVTLQDALYNVALFFGDGTRGCERNVLCVDTIATMSFTRSGYVSNDSLLYLVNFTDNKGFALLSSDDRLQPIYAISDEGKLTLDDFEKSDPLQMFLEGVKVNISQLLESTKNTPHVFEGIYGVDCVYKPQVEPLIWFYPRKWNQNAPYNKYCHYFDTGLGKDTIGDVGCTAVAVAQILSFFEYPKKIGGRSISWPAVKSGGGTDLVARIMRTLGNPENLDIEYSCEGSGAFPANVSRTFVNMNYKAPQSYKNFSVSKVRKCLDNASMYSTEGYSPVIMLGINQRTGVSHLWVIDGYACNVKKFDGITPFSIPNATLFHCVWGGLTNGYFYFGDNDTMGGNLIAYDANDDPNAGQSPSGYVYGQLKYMTGFIPDK